MSGNFEGIKTQKFGIEVECTGLTRSAAAKAVAKVIGGSTEHFGGNYDRYDVYDGRNRLWKIMSDGSIRCTNKNGNPASKFCSVELVTPILEYEDMATLQEVIRSIRRSGGVCNESIEIHIHIDFTSYDVQKLRNLVNIFASKEDMLYRALQVYNVNYIGNAGYPQIVTEELWNTVQNKKNTSGYSRRYSQSRSAI